MYSTAYAGANGIAYVQRWEVNRNQRTQTQQHEESALATARKIIRKAKAEQLVHIARRSLELGFSRGCKCWVLSGITQENPGCTGRGKRKQAACYGESKAVYCG